MPKMSKSEAMIEAQREMCAELEEQRRLLEQILQVCTTTADGLNENRSHVQDQFNRNGERIDERFRKVESRVNALEKVSGRDAE